MPEDYRDMSKTTAITHIESARKEKLAELSKGKWDDRERPVDARDSRRLRFALVGTLTFPIIGTIIAYFIGRMYPNDILRKEIKDAQSTAAGFALAKAEDLKKGGANLEDKDIAGFVKEAEKLRYVAEKGRNLTNNTGMWATLFTFPLAGFTALYVMGLMREGVKFMINRSAEKIGEEAKIGYLDTSKTNKTRVKSQEGTSATSLNEKPQTMPNANKTEPKTEKNIKNNDTNKKAFAQNIKLPSSHVEVCKQVPGGDNLRQM